MLICKSVIIMDKKENLRFTITEKASQTLSIRLIVANHISYGWRT